VAAVSDLPGVQLHDLYEAYPDFDIDVGAEQQRLSAADLVVLHHPFYWYSVPPLLKQWIDVVLEHGWAYGREGRALRGKLALSALTTGGGEEAYQHGGFNRFTMRELLAPLEQTLVLCGMTYLPPFIVHGTHRLTPTDIDRHAADYRQTLAALRDDRLDLERARGFPRLNTDLAAVVRG
jgi:glutathione-regulated potassium-efflux system ancillary protein KefG